MICRVLNFSYKYTGKLKEQNKHIIRILLYFSIFLLGLLYSAQVLPHVHILMKCIYGAILMGLIILFSMNGPVKRVKWNRTMSIIWFLLGILQLVSGIVVSLEYLPMACVWLVGFPMLYLVWTNRKDYVTLFSEVAQAGNFCLWIIIVISALLYPLEAKAYSGFIKNTNGLGQWITFAFPLVVFLIYHEQNTRIKWIYRGEIALITFFAILSRGRTAILALGGMCLVYGAFRICNSPRNIQYLLKRLCAFALCAVVACGGYYIVNFAAGYLVDKLDISISDAEDPNEKDRIDEEDEDAHGISYYVAGSIDRLLGKDKTGHNLEDYSSGRTGIWQAALVQTNLLGHPSREHIVTERNGDVGSNVHNTVFQFIYDNGILTGLLFAVMMAYAWIKMLIITWRSHSLKGVEITFLMIQTGYILTALLTSLNLVFLYLIAFIYYLTFAIICDKDYLPNH